jgi:hypothetical protein
MTRRVACASRGLACAVAALVAVAGCGTGSTAPSADPNPEVTPIDGNGPIRITFAGANISPGSVVSGCGSLIEGCAGKLRVTIRLDPPSDGAVLYTRIYLHATNLIACLLGETAPFTVHARVPSVVEITLDRSDRCGTPTTIATMAAVVEGPIEVSSRQTWSLHYVFAP